MERPLLSFLSSIPFFLGSSTFSTYVDNSTHCLLSPGFLLSYSAFPYYKASSLQPAISFPTITRHPTKTLRTEFTTQQTNKPHNVLHPSVF